LLFSVAAQDSVAQCGHGGEEAATIIPVATPDGAGLDADRVILLTEVYVGVVHKDDARFGHGRLLSLEDMPLKGWLAKEPNSTPLRAAVATKTAATNDGFGGRRYLPTPVRVWYNNTSPADCLPS